MNRLELMSVGHIDLVIQIDVIIVKMYESFAVGASQHFHEQKKTSCRSTKFPDVKSKNYTSINKKFQVFFFYEKT